MASAQKVKSTSSISIKSISEVKPVTDMNGKKISPFQVDLNYSEYYKTKNNKGKSLPVAYDLRTAGPGGTPLVSAPKSKGACGACWAFATIGSLESGLLVDGLANPDFSENNLNNCPGLHLSHRKSKHHLLSKVYNNRSSNNTNKSKITSVRYII
ncbi:MAG: hypothetical protein K8R53_02700, partial [Bacteroidales bacterium]|nr:hypothetical protein [Bacteroidales bacterium]